MTLNKNRQEPWLIQLPSVFTFFSFGEVFPGHEYSEIEWDSHSTLLYSNVSRDHCQGPGFLRASVNRANSSNQDCYGK